MKNERILVIGAGGQLGSELFPHLAGIYGNASVVAADVKEPRGRSFPNFELVDVLDRASLDSLISKGGFTQVYHLAAVLSAVGETNPEFAWKLNMDGLFNVMEACAKNRIEKIFWPSSIAVFGPKSPKNQTPQDTIMDPVTVYGISKQAGERWCNWYHQRYGLDVRSLRFPGLVGYKNRAGGGTTDYAVDIFFKAVTEKKFECFLKPDTYLPMMYMDDALKAITDLMAADANRLTVRSSYNIAAMSFSPQDIAAEIRKLIPDFEIRYKPDYRQAIADSWPISIDDSKAKGDWGWSPAYDLRRMTEEIIKKLPGFHLQKQEVS